MRSDLAVNNVSTVHEEVVTPEKMEDIQITADGTVVDHGLHRALKQRHLQMIALGGVIGSVACVVLF